MSSTSSKRGPKPLADYKKQETMVENIERRMGEFDQKLINNLPTIYEKLYDMMLASGDFKGISIKDQKAVLMWGIKRVEDKYPKQKVLGSIKEDDNEGYVQEDNTVTKFPMLK